VYSGGSISWQDAMLMSSKERQTAVKVIDEYNKRKSGKPVQEYL
jgi:hypothetical protein